MAGVLVDPREGAPELACIKDEGAWFFRAVVQQLVLIADQLSTLRMDDLLASELLRRARRAAGLSQRQLAKRAGTSQSVIARIELGTTDPSTETLSRLLAASGHVLRCRLLRLARGGAVVRRSIDGGGKAPEGTGRTQV